VAAQFEALSGADTVDSIWQGVVEDFSDIPSASDALRVVVRLSVASGLGGILGLERAFHGKAAGMRTHMLVALGAALFALIPQLAGMPMSEMGRVVQGIVTGIGFIGAGAILKHSEEQQVKGLTTAAGLWVTAAIGMAAGMGREMSALVGTGLAFIVLAFFQGIEDRVTGGANHKEAP